MHNSFQLGTIVGVVCYTVMSSLQILLSLSFVLTLTAWKTFAKGFQQRRAEEISEQEAAQDVEMQIAIARPVVAPSEETAALLEDADKVVIVPKTKLVGFAFLVAVHAVCVIAAGGPVHILNVASQIEIQITRRSTNRTTRFEKHLHYTEQIR